MPGELAKARPEPAPQGFSLTNEDDGPEEPLFTCKDDDCGWEGTEDEADTNANDQPVCPECGKRVRRTDD